MMTIEERRKVLDMVAGGKLSAAEGAELLSRAAEGERDVQDTQDASKPDTTAEWDKQQPESTMQFPESEKEALSAGDGPRWLHVRVDDLRSGKRKLSVNIPLRLIKFGLQLGNKWTPEVGGLDWDELSAAVANGDDGILIDVQDDEDGEHVQIYVD